MRSTRWGLAGLTALFLVAWFVPEDAFARGGRRGGEKRKGGSARTRVAGKKRAGRTRTRASTRSRRRRQGTRARPGTSAAAGRTRPRTATQRRPRRPLPPTANRSRIGRQQRLSRSPRVRFREKQTRVVNGRTVTVTRITQPGGPAPYRSGSRTRQLQRVMSNREILAGQHVRETVRAAEALRKLKGKMPADPRDRR